MHPRSLALSTWAIVALLSSPLSAQGPTMGSSVDMLGFVVTDAEFSRSLNRIVAVSTAPSNRLHVHDPLSGSGSFADLPLAGSCVSVSPDGRRAAVGHNGFVSWVDLVSVTLLATFPVSCDCNDVVLAGNGFIYAFPRTGQWVSARCIDTSTGAETLSSGFSIRHGTIAKLHPDGTTIYGADNGLSPADIEKYDISAGTLQYLYDSPYHGDYGMGGDLWMSEDGLRIFVRAGNVFRSSPIRAEDMRFNGSLSELELVTWLDHSTEAGKVCAIPEEPFFGGGAGDTELQVYDYRFLAHEGTYPFPRIQAGATTHASHGRFVFFEEDGDRAWAVVRADPSSGLLFDDGVVRIDFAIAQDPISGDTESVSIATGSLQTMTLDAGPSNAGRIYMLLGSANGTVPGIPFRVGTLPLNFEPVYFMHTAGSPNQWPLAGSLGYLDAQGRATASFGVGVGRIPAGVAGLVLHHAFFVLDGAGEVAMTSNALPVRIDP